MIDNIAPYITQEILYYLLSNLVLDVVDGKEQKLNVEFIKIPRVRDTNRLRGYAFVGI